MNKKLFVTILVIASILLGVTPAFGQNSNNRVEVTETAPLQISGGACWEGVRFTSGFIQNNFHLIQLPDGGVQIKWTRLTNVGGVGVATGFAYEGQENFTYTFHLQQKGQYVLPQHLFFRLRQLNTGKYFTVKQQSVVTYDPIDDIKVRVNAYEVGCPE